MANERVAFVVGVLAGAYLLPYLLKIVWSFRDRALNRG